MGLKCPLSASRPWASFGPRQKKKSSITTLHFLHHKFLLLKGPTSSEPFIWKEALQRWMPCSGPTGRALVLCPQLGTSQHTTSETSQLHQGPSLFPPASCKCSLPFDGAAQNSSRVNPHSQQPLHIPRKCPRVRDNIQGTGEEMSISGKQIHD